MRHCRAIAKLLLRQLIGMDWPDYRLVAGVINSIGDFRIPAIDKFYRSYQTQFRL